MEYVFNNLVILYPIVKVAIIIIQVNKKNAFNALKITQ